MAGTRYSGSAGPWNLSTTRPGSRAIRSCRAEDWRWSVTPYLWAIGSELSTSVDVPGDAALRFSDLIDKLDFAAQVHLEAHRGRHGLLLDVTNLQLSDRINLAFGNQQDLINPHLIIGGPTLGYAFRF